MKHYIFFIFALFSVAGYSQENLAEFLKKHNKKHIPYITVGALHNDSIKPLLLDARELYEYNVSHIENARFVGYKTFELNKVQGFIKNKDQKIVVYCTLGLRSEDIASKLKKAGYTNVYNLFGGIVEWKNNELKVYDSTNVVTEKIHVSSKQWSKWLRNGEMIWD